MIARIVQQLRSTAGGASEIIPPVEEETVVPFYVIWGQSNTGWTSKDRLSAELIAIYGNAQPSAMLLNAAYNSSTALPLHCGVNTGCTNSPAPDHFGFETSFAYDMQALAPKQRWYLKHGVGATSLAVDWLPPSGVMWNQFKAALHTVAGEALSAGKKLALKAVISMHGEQDGNISQDTADAYLQNFITFNTAFDTEWQGIVNTHNFGTLTNTYKRIVGRIKPGWPFGSAVRVAQSDFCNVVGNRAIIMNTDNYPVDNDNNIHINSPGQISYGTDLFDILKNYE